MGTPHKHADVIKAWADGAQIQYRAAKDGIWQDTDAPQWNLAWDYKVKEVRPTVRVWPSAQGPDCTTVFIVDLITGNNEVQWLAAFRKYGAAYWWSVSYANQHNYERYNDVPDNLRDTD